MRNSRDQFEAASKPNGEGDTSRGEGGGERSCCGACLSVGIGGCPDGRRPGGDVCGGEGDGGDGAGKLAQLDREVVLVVVGTA